MLEDRPGERVVAPRLQRRGALEQLPLVVAGERHDLDHGRRPRVSVPVLSSAMALSPAGCST